MKINSVYIPYLWDRHRCLLLYGGAGSGKSYFAAQKIILRMLYEKGHRILLVRKTAKSILNSQYQLLVDIIRDLNLEEHFKCVKTRMEITCLLNGNTIISTGIDDPEKIKSLAQPTCIWIEEATQLNPKDFRQLNLRLRGVKHTYMQIIMTFNPITKHHWLYKDFIARNADNTNILLTTWQDNRHLDDDYKNVLEDLKETDPDYYKIYALGQWGDHSKELIYDYELTDEMPKTEEAVFGMDFGYNNPSVLVKVAIEQKNLYVQEVFYSHNITNSDVIPLLKKYIPTRHTEIYADAAEPNRIEEIHREGFNIHPALKEVQDGIDRVKRYKLHVVRGSTNLIRELDNYKWKQDKAGQLLDAPDKRDDHACDALRYAVYSHLNRKRKKVLAIV